MSEAPAMEEWRRRAYLGAMGVTLWERRLADEAEALRSAETGMEPQPAQVADRTDNMARAGQGHAHLHAAASPMTQSLPRAEPVLEQVPKTKASQDGSLPLETVETGLRGTEGMSWPELRAAVAACRACGLCETRTQTVFGVGSEDADLMVIGEAPGADEDREGEPFVGRAGQLLTRMLAAIGYSREQVYIANVLKCRPPGNRDPKPEEALQCEPFLLRQMELIRPRLILSVGRISAQHLLRTDTSVGRLRGRWLEFGEQGIPLRVTYHPAYLLRSPEQKAKAWEDLTEVRRRLDRLSG